MSSNAAQFELSDILLTLDNHLNQQTASEHLDAPAMDLDRQPKSSTPEPPDEHELLAMRTRALSIRDSKGKGKEDTSWDELIEIVLRLAAAAPARAQVLEQAETIRRLSLQQDFLLERMSDERESWNSERESMQRVCEALIAQANIASHNLYKEQDNSKKPAIIEAENASLRQKLADAQSRVSSLEAELSQLRPLLLMQPSAIAQSRGLTLSPVKPVKKEEGSSKASNAESRSYYRVRDEKASASTTSTPKSIKKKSSSYFKHAPTVADARSEHLLLAARKLGRERASLLSQAIYRTAEPQGPSTAPNHELTMHIKGTANPSRPMMTPAVWPNHLQQPNQAGRQSNPQGQQSGTSGTIKGQQNPPFSQFGPPGGVAYPHPQQYFIPSGSVGRPPGTAMPAPTFYHAPARGYIPGPAWPYYSPGPYAFGQPIAIQNPGANANANKAAPGRPMISPPVVGPSRSSAPANTQNTTPSSQKAKEKETSPRQGQKPPSRGQQGKSVKTPQSKTAVSAPTGRNPPTPMDRLLSAAQTVFSPGSRDRSPSVENEGSPSPKKRRRVDQHQGQSAETNPLALGASSSQASSALERHASALDVLADQAAGVGSSSRRPRSGNKARDKASLAPTRTTQAQSTSSSQSRTNRLTEQKETSTSVESDNLTEVPATGVNDRPPTARKSKRPARSSSTTPASGTSSLAVPMTAQRAASEEHAISAFSVSQATGNSYSYKLRPVQPDAVQGGKNIPGRSASLPRTSGPSGARRGRQVNGRASTTPLRPPLPRAPTSEADIDAEGDDVESEDDIDVKEADGAHREDNDSPSKDEFGKKKKGPALLPSSGEDVNSRRWLEILGRRDT